MNSIPEERYDRDPIFRSLVDTMTHFILTAQYTPTELREAALLASIRYDSHQIRQCRKWPEMYEIEPIIKIKTQAFPGVKVRGE